MILLRQQIDEILKEEGFDSLYIKRATDGSLTLASNKCGENIIHIKNINVPKKLTKKERDYIFELISSYIKNNKKEIKKIITARKLINNLKEEKEKIFKERNTRKKYYGIEYEKTMKIGEAVLSFRMVNKDKVELRLDCYKIEDYPTHKKIKEETDKFIKDVEILEEIERNIKELEEEINKFNTCEL